MRISDLDSSSEALSVSPVVLGSALLRFQPVGGDYALPITLYPTKFSLYLEHGSNPPIHTFQHKYSRIQISPIHPSTPILQISNATSTLPAFAICFSPSSLGGAAGGGVHVFRVFSIICGGKGGGWGSCWKKNQGNDVFLCERGEGLFVLLFTAEG